MKRKFLSSMLAAALLYVGSFSAGAMGVEEVSVPNKQLPALQQSPAGEYATVLEMQVKSGMESVMTVKTDMYDRLVMRFSNTLLMDTQTGTPVSETDIAAGDKVFVYYADYVRFWSTWRMDMRRRACSLRKPSSIPRRRMGALPS